MTLVDRAELGDHFAAILADRSADAPRLALADFLTAHGDPRGDNIRLECQLEPLAIGDPARADLHTRAAALPHFTYFIATPPWHVGYTRRRGFVNEVEWRPAHLAAHGAALMSAAPVTTLRILGGHGEGAMVAACPALARLMRLRLPSLPGDDVFTILASPHLAALRSLELSSLQLDARLAARLIIALRPLHALRHLDLSWGPIDRAARAILGDFAQGADLAIPALLPRPPAPPRPTAHESLTRPRAGRADLSHATPSANTLVELLARGPYPDVHTIDLGETLDDALLDVLSSAAAQRTLPALRTIERSHVWRHTFDGREETERTTLTRPDGSVIDCITEHSMWP